MIRLVQLTHRKYGRCVAMVEDDYLRRLSEFSSVYDLAHEAMRSGNSLAQIVEANLATERMKYGPIYDGESDWLFLPAFDHPTDPNSCLVSGTGLTHKASAANRQAMHEEDGHQDITDSMLMYQWGLEGGRPDSGNVGVQPEWFYKGHGTVLRGHRDKLQTPVYGKDGGEEPEVAGAYTIGDDGGVSRIGFMTANEFSDHVMEKSNYLYLAPSKLRNCSIGPELVVGVSFDDLTGTVSVHRNQDLVWQKDVRTGEANMSHSVANLEHHHFKYDTHRRPGDAHIHFYGADAFSFGEGVVLQDGDTMMVQWDGLGRPLQNTLSIEKGREEAVAIQELA